MKILLAFYIIANLSSSVHTTLNQQHHVFYEEAEKMDGISIVRGVRRFRTLPSDIHFDEVEIIDSLAYKKGQIIHTFFVGNDDHDDLETVVKPGATYLLLMRRRPGKATQEIIDGPESAPLSMDHVRSLSVDAYPEAVFETTKLQLSVGKDAREGLVNSLADCLVGATSSTGKNIIDLLLPAGGAHYTSAEDLLRGEKFGRSRSDRELVNRLEEVAETARPELRARIYGLLDRWQVEGIAEKLSQSVYACLNEPTAFQLRYDEVPEVSYIPKGGNEGVNTLPGNEWIDMLLRAKNTVVLAAVLDGGVGQVFPLPDEAHLQRLAEFLNSSDEGVQAGACNSLARFLKMPEKAVNHNSKDGRKNFPKLSEALSFWREKFGVPPP